MLEHISPAISSLLNLQVFGLIIVGVIVGIIGGALPGITATVTVALVLPLTFQLEPVLALATLAAVYMAAEFGGSISAILINTPGTPAAICTALDGFPMAREGRAHEALNFAVIASSIGGILGVLVLLFFTPPLAEFSLRFGSAEQFWMAIAGLSIVCTLTAENFTKGVISAGIGLFVAGIGTDPVSSIHRFTFNVLALEDGINLIPAALGLFAVPQMLILISRKEGVVEELKPQPGALSTAFTYTMKRLSLLLRSSFIGVLIGILPGAGAGIASFVSYGEAKRISKEDRKFGEGNPEGIVASESANNAMVGGSLVPLLAFGIPGSPSAAILFGALTINGFVPGPSLFNENGEVTYAFMMSFFPAIALMLLFGIYGARAFASVLKLNRAYIIATVLLLAVIGSYSARSDMADGYIMVAFGLLGFGLTKFGFSIAPVILGLILGPMAEEGFRRSLDIGNLQGSVWLYFFGRPISVILIMVTALMVITAFWQEAKRKRENKQDL